MTTIDYKKDYIEILKELKFYNKKYVKDSFKSNSYAKAIEIIENLNGELNDSSQIKDLSWIGKAMIDKLNEFISTKQVKNLNSLREKYPEGAEEYKKEKIKEIFMQIHGIGEKRGQEIIDLNIFTIEELKKAEDTLKTEQAAAQPVEDELAQVALNSVCNTRLDNLNCSAGKTGLRACQARRS